MYNVKVANNINKTPWEISYDERAKELNGSIYLGYKVNLIIYEFPDTSTFRYRGYNIYQATRESKLWKAIYFFKHELKKLLPFLSKVDIVTIVRVRWSFELQDFINKVRQNHIPIAFDIDDRVFDIDYLPLVTNTLNVNMVSDKDYEYWFSYISRIGFTASMADAYITTNDFLAKALEDKYNKPSYIIPNFLNEEQITVSKGIRSKKSLSTYKKPFIIGYFSGTPSHINDFKIVYKEIMQLLIDFPDMQLNVVGFMEFPKEMQELINKGRITFSNLVDFLTLQELIAAVDVNIVPLVINDFTNCKSELKYFEAALVDTVTCASPNFTYKNSITDGRNGFLCKQSEWYDKIKAIYLNEIDTQKIRENAYCHTQENYQGDVILQTIESCYNNLCSNKF